jgi:hypothetical protein
VKKLEETLKEEKAQLKAAIQQEMAMKDAILDAHLRKMKGSFTDEEVYQLLYSDLS